jgi:hypothetical protein
MKHGPQHVLGIDLTSALEPNKTTGILHPIGRSQFLLNDKSLSHFMTGGLPPISSPRRQAPRGPRPAYFFGFATEPLRL